MDCKKGTDWDLQNEFIQHGHEVLRLLFVKFSRRQPPEVGEYGLQRLHQRHRLVCDHNLKKTTRIFHFNLQFRVPKIWKPLFVLLNVLKLK